MDERTRRGRRGTPDAPRAAAPGPAARPAGLAALASAVGNARFARAVTPGSGIAGDGTVRPEIEQAIRGRAGRGAALDGRIAASASPALGPLGHVNVHHDATADALARSVSARAFTVRNDVFFARGQYRPDSADGRRLIAHELTHVAQQRGAPTGGALRVTEPGDAHERHADSVADELAG